MGQLLCWYFCSIWYRRCLSKSYKEKAHWVTDQEREISSASLHASCFSSAVRFSSSPTWELVHGLSDLHRKAYLMWAQVGISSKSGVRGRTEAERLWVEAVNDGVAPGFQIHGAGFFSWSSELQQQDCASARAPAALDPIPARGPRQCWWWKGKGNGEDL